MSKAIQVFETGGSERLKWKDVEVASPGDGDVLIKHTAVGLNYIDVYFRTGIYPPPTLPFTPGLEGAGVVEAAGANVSELKVGDRVAYAALPLGAYAEQRVMPADKVVKLPDGVTNQTAAAMMLKGMTAQYLLRSTYRVKAGETILFHAAAGGVGLIACQWAKHLGVNVIGTVGSAEKAELAKQNGCAHTINYNEEDVVQRVKDLTDGAGVPVVYDSVGKSTFLKSLDCLSPLGMLVSFGQSSGKVEPLDIGVLSAKGSLFLTRPTLMTYTAKRDDMVNSANELFDVVASGAVRINVKQTYALADAKQAHDDLEGRKTTGSTLLLV